MNNLKSILIINNYEFSIFIFLGSKKELNKSLNWFKKIIPIEDFNLKVSKSRWRTSWENLGKYKPNERNLISDPLFHCLDVFSKREEDSKPLTLNSVNRHKAVCLSYRFNFHKRTKY